MAEKVKKKPPFFNFKRWNSQKMSEDLMSSSPSSASPKLLAQGDIPVYRTQNGSVATRTTNPNTESKPRK